jgi:hypothetical protein
MADEVIHHSSDFGRVASHPTRELQPLLVAPTTDALFNTLGLDLIPVACMSLHDILFAFDSSFVTKSITTILQELPGLRDSHKIDGQLPRLSIFGHADPVGEDELNKQLSGRRATAIYGMLTQNTGIWHKLLNHPSPFGDDNWRTQKVTARMRAVVGDDPKTDDDLITAYLAAICPFQLQPTEFLGNGDDSDGKADFQGCSSFNPQTILSVHQNETETHDERNRLNQPNRRVVVFLFRAGTKVNPGLWPCPTATQVTTKCRARFFGPPVTGDDRRQPNDLLERFHVVTASPEIDAPDDTFACRFYSRISHLSPCEGKIIPVFRTIHVFLKLMYKDPEDPAGKVRNFPPDVPVIVDDGGGTVLTVKTIAGGFLDFVFDRDRHQFTLRCELGNGQYFAAAGADTKGAADRLVAESDLPDVIADHYRFFKVPPKWSLADTDWGVESPVFSQNFFRNLDNPATTVGILENPVRMTLDPHWQYLRFTYFDRFLKKNLSIPPVTMEGFLHAKGSGSPDTHSNWTVQPPDTLQQCLPWILRTPPKPDKDTLIQFKTDADTFIEVKQDGSRQLVAGTKHDTPLPNRLHFYDLPVLWKSSHYLARFSNPSGIDTSKDGFYEKVADRATSLAQPMMFSLDDMVLTDAGIHPIAWTAKDRVAIFKNTFSDRDGDGLDLEVSEIGLFNADTDHTESYLTQQPRFDTGGNYIAEYPEWTRLLVVKGNLFDVFDRRTASGPVIGARAAVRWVESASKGPAGTQHPATQVQDGGHFFTIQPYFEQSHKSDLAKDFRIGRFDMALLRCCDNVPDSLLLTELAVVFNYFPYHFNYRPPPDTEHNSKPLDPPLSNDKTEQQKFADLAVRTLARRWNGIKEPLGSFGPGAPQLLPDTSDPTATGTAPRLQANIIFFAQSLPLGLAHLSWRIYKEVRANAGSRDGIGSLKESEGEPRSAGLGRLGDFTLAHETGHIYSLGDEYVESSDYASGGHLGIISFSPGSPYAISGPDMMLSNSDVSPRYYWHAAEWLHSLKPVAFPFQVTQGQFEYRLPHHPDLPLRSFVNHPLAEKRDTSSNGSGKFDIFVYPFGAEPFNVQRLQTFARSLTPPREPPAKYDATVIVLVKFKVHIFKNDDKLVDECINAINLSIVENFDNMWTVKGSVQRAFFSGAGTFSFNSAYVIFQSRFLVQNFPQNKDLRQSMQVTNEADYLVKVQALETGHGIHVEVRTQAKGTTHWDVKPDPAAGGKAAPRGRLIISHEDLKDDAAFKEAFRAFFWNMLGFPDAKPKAGTAQLQEIVRQVVPDAELTLLTKPSI